MHRSLLLTSLFCNVSLLSCFLDRFLVKLLLPLSMLNVYIFVNSALLRCFSAIVLPQSLSSNCVAPPINDKSLLTPLFYDVSLLLCFHNRLLVAIEKVLLPYQC